MSAVATPVVANDVQYDASWTCTQKGGWMKLPDASLSPAIEAAQKEISPEVTASRISVRNETSSRRSEHTERADQKRYGDHENPDSSTRGIEGINAPDDNYVS